LNLNSKAKIEKNQTAEIMVLMAHSRIFGNLSKSILVMVPTDDLSLMICYSIIQIHKNNCGQKEIVSMVEKQLIDIRFLENFQELLNT
jgi:hypothetical protein